MATTLYKLQIEAFLRETEGRDVTLNLAVGGFGFTQLRYSLKQIYDYFWLAGIALQRVIKRLDPAELEAQLPAYVSSETISLTSGVGNIANKYDRIFDDAILNTGVICRKIGMTLTGEFKNTTGYRRSPTDEAPIFEAYTDAGVNKVKVYPTTAGSSINIKGYLTVERIELSNSNYDIWNNNLSDILIEGAVALAKGTGNERTVEQMMAQHLEKKYQLYLKKSSKQNDSSIEEQK